MLIYFLHILSSRFFFSFSLNYDLIGEKKQEQSNAEKILLNCTTILF